MTESTERHVALTGMLLSVLCLAYFYLLDRLLFSSATFSLIFSYLLKIYDVQTAWLGVGVCLLALLWRRPAPILRLIDWLSRHPAIVAAGTVLAFGLGSVTIYHNYPLCMDEYAAVFQSKLFAAGRLFSQFPANAVDWLVAPSFNGSFFIASHATGRVIEGYWPGFAGLLTPFQFLGAPWLCNPVLSGVAVLLLFRITLDITGDRRLAGWAMLFALASGAFFLNGISYYAMQAHLAANLLFAWLLLKPDRTRAIAAGFVGSVALVLHNPLPHVLFALPWVVSIAIDRRQRALLLPLIAGYLPVGLGVGLGWLSLRSSLMPAGDAMAAASSVVNGVFKWPNAAMLNMRVAALAKIWVWAVPCLLFYAVLGLRQFADNKHIRLLSMSAALTFFAYLFVNLDQGHGWGYRYFHSAWGVLPILAACALAGKSEAHSPLTAFAGAAAILNLLLVIPFQLSQVDGFIGRHLAQLPDPKRPGNNVYFIRPGGFYVADMIQIDPLLRDQDLLLASRGDDVDEAMIRRNWPGAVLRERGFWAVQWYLGSTDRRVSSAGDSLGKHFVIQGAPSSPPAASDHR